MSDSSILKSTSVAALFRQRHANRHLLSITLFWIATFFTALSTGCSNQEANWKEAKAVLLARQGRMEEAIKLMKDAAKDAEPGSPLRLRLARMLSSHGEGDLGLNQCDMFISENPQDLAGYDCRSDCLLSLGRFAEALEDYKKSISDRISRDSSELNQLAYNRALAKVELPEALDAIEKAINEVEGRVWYSNLKLPFEYQTLVSTGVIARYTGQQADVLKELDKQIQRLESIVSLRENGLKTGLTLKVRNTDRLDAKLASSFEDSRLLWEYRKHSLTGLLMIRAFLREDLGQKELVDQDRRRIFELDFEFDELAAQLPLPRSSLVTMDTGSAYLDTRGFVKFQLRWSDGRGNETLGISSNYADALNDLNIAILAAEVHKEAINSPLYNSPDIPVAVIQPRKEQILKTLAVLLYHRMLIHQKGNQTELEKADSQRIIELGFRPEEGLF